LWNRVRFDAKSSGFVRRVRIRLNYATLDPFNNDMTFEKDVTKLLLQLLKSFEKEIASIAIWNLVHHGWMDEKEEGLTG
jgi:hypothetical protein